MNLNTDTWKEFLLCNLFEITYGNKFDKNKMEHENPTINFVSRTEKNNGVSDIVDEIKGVKPFEEGNMTIALGGSIGKCFIQTKPFYTGQNMAVCITKHLSTEIKIFISNIIMNEVNTKFCAFGRELNRHIKTDFSIYLPIKYNEYNSPLIDFTYKYSKEGYIPDWQFMEDFIKSLHYKYITTKNKKNDIVKLNTFYWKDFSLSDLFTIEAGKYYSKEEYDNGKTPYISTAATFNGIASLTNLESDYDGNKITIGKLGAVAFYQKYPFCATSDVNVLTPLFNLNEYVGLFITQIINFNENYKWNYGRQCRVEDTRNIVIKLPIQYNEDGSPKIDTTHKYNSDGYIPDWKFMSNYIKFLPYGDRLFVGDRDYIKLLPYSDKI